MNYTFELKKGKLVFEGDKIIILDNEKNQKYFRLLMSGGWIIFGVLFVLRYLKSGDQFLLWAGLFIGISHLIIFIAFLFRSVQSEINKKEVKSMKLKERFGNDFLDIKLNYYRIRRVNQIDKTRELQEYIDTLF